MKNENTVAIKIDSNIDEVLKKVKKLNNKLKEAKTLVDELASMEIEISFLNNEGSIKVDHDKIAKEMKKALNHQTQLSPDSLGRLL